MMASQQALQPTDDTGRWIVHKAPNVDPAWALADAIRQRPLPPPSPALQQKKTRYVAYIQGFLSRSNDTHATTAFRTCTTWEAVRKEAEEALDIYANQGKSWNNPFRRTKRLVGNMSCRIEFLTVLIPSGDYLGALCGGLKLVYQAARRSRDLRELILGSLQALEVEIDYAKTYIREYAWNDELRQKTENLYIAVLDAVEEITKWIEKSKGLRGFFFEPVKAVVQQGDYGKKLEAAVKDNVTEKVEAFDRAVQACLHTEVRDTGKNVITVGRLLEVVHGQIDGQTGDLQKMSATVSTLEDLSLRKQQRLQDERQRELQARNEQHLIQILRTQQALNAMAKPWQPTVSLPQILTCLRLAEAGPNQDVTEQVVDRIGMERELVLHFGRTMNTHLQGRISTTMQDVRFGEWFKAPQSRTLVISGMDMNTLQSDMVSPLSYMCAVLARAVAEVQHAKPLAFFCRLHADPSDGMTGAAGMMRSLIAQLILFHTEVSGLLDFLGAADLQLIGTNDVPALCRLFDELVKRIGSGVIICMIDGINFFDKEMHARGLHYAMQFLNSLVEAAGSSHNRMVFKLMVTSPTTSEYFQYWFPNRLELIMPGEMLVQGQGFNELSMLK
ncbi:adenosine trna methylthiotransferase [Diplodia corticola]|uniref:Adenosine trna methylthiotransferase n=1 Tax=Diplodia corticola TaxID=236234 RepID=A0A1J9RYX9_9PEZI|nr:adenosine trna methylthiotransferase [Diplodia corticola]OJD32653.1 adenosine trna methylthiotransferase [Diplodia corticola]